MKELHSITRVTSLLHPAGTKQAFVHSGVFAMLLLVLELEKLTVDFIRNSSTEAKGVWNLQQTIADYL